MAKPKEPFEELAMPRKDVPHLQSSRYRVYKNPKEFVTVEAISALEALQASGVKNPTRIERDLFQLASILELNSFGGDPQADAQLNDTPMAPAAAPEETAPPAAPAADTPLSGDDVNKLLGEDNKPA